MLQHLRILGLFEIHIFISVNKNAIEVSAVGLSQVPFARKQRETEF